MRAKCFATNFLCIIRKMFGETWNLKSAFFLHLDLSSLYFLDLSAYLGAE